MSLSEDCMRGFRGIYPDGKLISIIRSPVGWYRSVKGRGQKKRRPDQAYVDGIQHYSGFEGAEHGYLQNCKAIRRNADSFGQDFVLLDYDELVASREPVMRALASRIGIDFDPIMLKQTFNGMPITANTSFQSDAERRNALAEDDIRRVAEGPMTATYEDLRQLPARIEMTYRG